ncbi:MAG TPA: hypothetical protein VMV93_13445 [Chloroflexota bacterium]|nr:hypothetical protein [Chloroflexota bacterium]
MASNIFGGSAPRALLQSPVVRARSGAPAQSGGGTVSAHATSRVAADSVNISSAARIVAAMAKRTALLTASDGSPEDVPAVHPVLNGNTALQLGHDMLSGLGQ